MELIKRNIHMDRTRVQAVTQFTLEDDVNLPEKIGRASCRERVSASV